MFYGWKLCFLSMIGNFLLQGSILYMMNAFVDPLCALHGFTRAELSLSMSVGALLFGLSIPFWSNLCLRHSLRELMTIGAFIGGISIICLGYVHSIYAFTLFYSIAGICGQAFGGVIASILINNWFNKAKGRAFGLFTVGISLSGAIIPFIVLLIIDHFSVRTAFIAYGVTVLIFTPITWFMVRDTPEEMGLYVDGLVPHDAHIETKAHHIDKPTINIPWKTVLLDKDTYIVAWIFIFSITVAGSISSQLVPHLLDIGITTYTAVILSSLVSLGFSVTKFFWGASCDYYNPIKITRLMTFGMLFSVLFLFLPPNIYLLYIFAFSLGIFGGGFWSVMPVLVSFYFGQDKFVFYYRAISTFLFLRAFGYLVLGISQSFTNSYILAYVVFEIIILISVIFSFILPITPRKEK